MVQGAVLICRSPCNMPGDIQKAYAVQGRTGQPFEYLKNTLVFSAKGARPLTDQLSGGDLDGDEYYIIKEKNFVGLLQSAIPHDFGSKKTDHQLRPKIDVSQSFTVPNSVQAPNISSQLEVFGQLMSLGNMVADTSDAWIRIADFEGPGTPRAIRMAEACLQALDARKMATKFEPGRTKEVRTILREVKAPHWKCGEKSGRKSDSSKFNDCLRRVSCGVLCTNRLLIAIPVFHYYSPWQSIHKMVLVD
jgi:hypothetical protein